jgi:hypothetical protein
VQNKKTGANIIVGLHVLWPGLFWLVTRSVEPVEKLRIRDLKARKQLILLDAKELNYLLLGFFDRHVMHEATKRGEAL